MKSTKNFLIFMVQLIGVLLVGIGLEMIWEPLAWIYHGIVFFVFGHVLFLVMKSEDGSK